MKFWKKLVLFIITVISVILSCSRYYIVRNNFMNSISNSSKQNEGQNILERYMLESNLTKDIQNGKEVTNEMIADYIKSLDTYMEKNTELIAIYDENYQIIYSNIELLDEISIKSLLNDKSEYYAIKEIKGNHYMQFFSYWTINNKKVYIINAYNIENIYEERQRQLKDILYTDIIILALSSIVIFAFSFYLTRPIKRLNNTSKKIASGKFNERVKIKSKDEIGELADSFNIMADQIENKIDELNVLIKSKDDFINGFTHELKTPMTSIMGYADLLRLKKCDEELTQKALNYIYSEAKRLENLSYKLMEMMALSEEKINTKSININQLISNVLKYQKFILTNNKIETDIENAAILGDIELLEIVMRNLIENANKAEPKDNKIKIHGKILENGRYRISVIDKGKGIPKEHLNRVTEDFYMVDKSRNKANGGTGIGLALVKRILKFHNSNIYIESTENIGTTVYFDLERSIKNEEN